MKIALSLIQMMLAAALAYSCFCRLVHTDLTTIREVRLSIWFQGIAAGIVGGAPLLPLLHPLFRWQPWHTPWTVWCLLLLSAVLMQLVTAKYWRDGVPLEFLED